MVRNGIRISGLGWFEGENLVSYVKKFGKGITGKNLVQGAFAMKIDLSEREYQNLDTANTVLKARENEVERTEGERETKRARWADMMDEDEQEGQRRTGYSNNQGWGTYNRRWSRDERDRRRGYERIEIDESRLRDYRVIERDFENGLFGLETVEGGKRCFGVANRVLYEKKFGIKGLYNAVFTVNRTDEGDTIEDVFESGMDRKVKDFCYEGELAFCCGCRSGRTLYKWRKMGYVSGFYKNRNEGIMILKLGPMGATNLGLDLEQQHRCGSEDYVD